MKVIGLKSSRKILDQFITKDKWMIFLFDKPKHAQFFLKNIDKKHKNIKFSIETELNGSLSFLDAKIFREDERFATSAFRKDTFFIPIEYKSGLVYILLNHCFKLSFDF